MDNTLWLFFDNSVCLAFIPSQMLISKYIVKLSPLLTRMSCTVCIV